MQTYQEPTLQAPGAGLPWLENRIARILLGWKSRFGRPATFIAQFETERRRIHALIEKCGDEQLTRRVLIARLPGLEDSSRYWSVAMTLDHLRIVHHAFIGVLTALANEKIPPGEASTAAVKPRVDVSREVIAMYEESCDALLSCAAGIRDFKTKARFSHPWFGPMDAHRWLALAAGHMAIHRRQIERILGS
jgi:uncharacterized damage-inducible protein DinB